MKKFQVLTEPYRYVLLLSRKKQNKIKVENVITGFL